MFKYVLKTVKRLLESAVVKMVGYWMSINIIWNQKGGVTLENIR